MFKFDRGQTRPQPTEIIQVVEERKKDCEKKQWVLYVNEAGEKVLVRDTLSKVCDWLNKFKEVGDTAIQFDPGHAALPWMAVRALLQASYVRPDYIIISLIRLRCLSMNAKHSVP